MDVTNAIAVLLSTEDSEEAFELVEQLENVASRGNESAVLGLCKYLSAGRLEHVREHVAYLLAEWPDRSSDRVKEALRRALSDPREGVVYWAIDGIVGFSGASSYPDIAEIALDDARSLMIRAQAIKALAASSGQKFDRGLPDDAAKWNLEDLRVSEVHGWAEAGFGIGVGYDTPKRDPALDAPGTRFERVVASLDRYLRERRRQEQDPANPTNWLERGDESRLSAIAARWSFSRRYVEFLARFSPLAVSIPYAWNDHEGELRLFGVRDLIEAQVGYAVNERGRPIPNWPGQYVVIASLEGDPFVVEAGDATVLDSPVLFSLHGQGQWVFEESACSLEAFIERLSQQDL